MNNLINNLYKINFISIEPRNTIAMLNFEVDKDADGETIKPTTYILLFTHDGYRNIYPCYLKNGVRHEYLCNGDLTLLDIDDTHPIIRRGEFNDSDSPKTQKQFVYNFVKDYIENNNIE